MKSPSRRAHGHPHHSRTHPDAYALPCRHKQVVYCEEISGHWFTYTLTTTATAILVVDTAYSSPFYAGIPDAFWAISARVHLTYKDCTQTRTRALSSLPHPHILTHMHMHSQVVYCEEISGHWFTYTLTTTATAILVVHTAYNSPFYAGIPYALWAILYQVLILSVLRFTQEFFHDSGMNVRSSK